MLPQDQRGFDDRLTKDSYYEVHWREIQIRNKELTKGCILMGKFFLKVFKLQVKNSINIANVMHISKYVHNCNLKNASAFVPIDLCIFLSVFKTFGFI